MQTTSSLPQPLAARAAPWWLAYLWAPWVAYVLAMALLIVSDGDERLGDALFALQGHAWALRDAFITEDLLHRFGRTLSIAAWVLGALALAWACMSRQSRWRLLRAPLAYLLLSVLTCTVAINLLKRWARIDCPWDLLRYGGSQAYVPWWEGGVQPAVSACFPAGHASAGYAWLALYFFALQAAPRQRRWLLALPLGAGLVFGFSQQLRGAHFISHDLTTALICWTIAVLLWRGLLALQAREARA